MAVLLGVWLIISCAYSVIIYNGEKQRLMGEAELKYARFSYFYNEIGDFYSVNNGLMDILELNRNENSQAVVRNSSREIIAHTDNTFFDWYGIEDGESELASFSFWMEYEDFRNAMTYKQYKKITDYLTGSPENDNKNYETYYELICTEFYPGSPCRPKTVEIVETREGNTWYVQDKVVQRFELEPDVPPAMPSEHCDQMHRNVIPTDFVLSGGRDEDIIGSLTKKEKYLSALNNESFVNTEAFTYIYYQQENVYFQPEGSPKQTDFYTVQYAYKFNVLDYCAYKIIWELVFVFVLFFLVGTVLWIMAWRIISNRELQEKKRRDLVSSMAHQLKTPLFVIDGYARNLKENVMTQKREHYAEVITQQTRSMNELVEKMLDFSSLEANGFKFTPERFDLSETANRAVEKFNIPAGDKSFKINIKPGIIITGDKKYTQTVMEIFIDNAVKYTEDNIITVELTDNCFSVANACSSLNKDDLKSIWEPYGRMKNSSQKPGTGLGLFIAKTILDRQGIEYSAKIKSGMLRVWFRLPNAL